MGKLYLLAVLFKTRKKGDVHPQPASLQRVVYRREERSPSSQRKGLLTKSTYGSKAREGVFQPRRDEKKVARGKLGVLKGKGKPTVSRRSFP